MSTGTILSRTLLRQVLALPTAPMHEEHVIAYVRAFADRLGLRCQSDRFGNLTIANRGRGKPKAIVMAHMDHPGIEIVQVRGKKATAKVRGGLYFPQVTKAKFCLFPNGGDPVRCRGVGEAGKGTIHLQLNETVPRSTFGMLDIPPVKIQHGIVHARVIDNLANCAQVLLWLQTFRRSQQPVVGVLTRGEEIGLKGAAALVRRKGLPRNVPIVVLEASSAKAAKVNIGDGPIIRVGDRTIGFDPRIDCWLQAAAKKLIMKDRTFRCQRALMPGGTMEASLYTLDGLMVGAMALPLGNYHNRGPRGPAPEYIAWKDWLNLQKLLCALVRAPTVNATVRKVRQQMLRR